MSKPSSVDRAFNNKNELPVVADGWLEGKLGVLPGIAAALAKCEDKDSIMREAVVLGRELLGFSRIGIWLLQDGGESAEGTFGVDQDGVVVDERGERISDNSGYIRRMMEAWNESPHYYERSRVDLRSADSKILGQGISITAPLFWDAEVIGFVAVDDLIESRSVNARTGPLLCQFGQVISSAYSLRKLKQELERSRLAVSEAERVQSEFIGMMGHEVRTPLNAMMGYAQLLRSRDLDSEISGIANTIEESGEHMKGLIDSVIEYSHLSSGDVRLWYKPGDAVETLESTVQSFLAAYREKGLELNLCIEGNRMPVCYDAVSLRQVVSNLLQNALKFTEIGGVDVKVFTRVEGDMTEFFIEVKDTGIGIDSEHQGSIFEPFKQVERKRDRAAGGIGMGLAIVKRLVAAMGGEISCLSQRNRGTVFSIDLSFSNEEGCDYLGFPQMGERDRSKSRVLIVDDDAINLEVLQSMAHCLGYLNTDFAMNGVEARELLAERPYDIVLMDVQMPRLDGLSLTRIVRAGAVCPINREVPIVGVTAYCNEHDRDECLMVGMNDYLAKPIDLEALRLAMELA